MSKSRDYYCKVYLDGYCEIEKIMDKKIENNAKFNEILDISLLYFHDFAKDLEKDPACFVCWPYYLEIEPIDIENKVDFHFYLLVLANLAIEIHKHNVKTVFSCDFEEEINQAIAKEEYARLTNS